MIERPGSGQEPQAAQGPRWHVLEAHETAHHLSVDLATGLSHAEAGRRLAAHGPNVLEESRRRGPLRILFEQFSDFMILVLLAAALVAGLLGDAQDTIAILVIVLLNALLGFVQEFRAERAMAALKQLAGASALVRRGGQTAMVPGSELVKGDLVLLEAGNIVPADLRLVEAARLRVEEAALTGESQPVEKHTTPLEAVESALGDRKNMAYKGTLVTYGRGVGLVVATGMATELGRIAYLLRQRVDVKTPLQRRLAVFGRRLSVLVLGICAVVFGVGVLHGGDVLLMFLTAVSLAVAAIPEALPAVVTVALALGARRMVKTRALVRKLPAVETLGSVTYICSDKTGTLTQNRMRVEDARVVEDGPSAGLAQAAAPGSVGAPGPHERGAAPEAAPPLRGAEAPRALGTPAPSTGSGSDARAEGGVAERLFLQALALANDAVAGPDGEVLGDPTEVALFEYAASQGFEKRILEQALPRVGEVPFDSERKRMTTLHGSRAGVIAFVKGAPESVLPLCERSAAGELDVPGVLRDAEAMATDGLRVLAIACRPLEALPAELTHERVERELVFLGLVGLLDPPREEAGEAVALCRTAGITPVMITGDHPATARAIASRLEIADDGGALLTGPELDRLSDAELEARVERVRVYARAAPEQKIRIIGALQRRGQLVAMTGDGVNDAPALRRADIGVAMGRGGTDVAREAASMVLLDDNFATIVRAVREGRRIFDNIRKFIKYTMTSNSGEIWTLFFAPLLGLPVPLLPIHILWINLVTDGLPGLALTVEPEEPGVMRRPPRPPGESVFAHGNAEHMVVIGLLMGGVSILTQAWAIDTGHRSWQSMVFTVLTLSQMGHVLAIRSERESLFKMRWSSNLPLLGAVALTFALQMATLYVPWLQPIFRTTALTAGELAACLALSTVVFLAVELEKGLVRHGWLYRRDAIRAGWTIMPRNA